MPIAWDTKGGTPGVGGVTSLSIDITTAAVGSVVICHVQIASNVGATTFTGWTLGAESDEGTSSHGALWWKVKQAGDTTFTVSWTGSNNATACWSSYTGVDTNTPFELLTQLNHIASSANYVTSSQTPTTATRWAVGTFGYRGTTAARTWTNTGTLTQRVESENTASRWSGTTIGDSNATVAQSAQSYTAVLSAAESHGTAFILFLISSGVADPGYLPSMVASGKFTGPPALRRYFRLPPTQWIDEGIELPAQYFTPTMVRIPSAMVGPPSLRQRFRPHFTIEAANLNVNVIASASDTLGAISDSAVRSAQNFVRTASDSLAALTDSAVSLVANIGRTAADSLAGMTDIATRLIALPRTAADSLTAITESVVRASQAFSRTASDALGAISDSAVRGAQSFVRTASDSLGAISDSAVRASQSFLRTASDTLGAITDTPVRAVQHFLRTASDTLSALSDSAVVGGASHVVVTAADTLSAVSDSAVRSVQNFTRVASDGLAAISESLLRAVALGRSAADTLASLVDTPIRAAQHPVRTASESLGAISDTALLVPKAVQFIAVAAISRSRILLMRSRDHLSKGLSRSRTYLARARNRVAAAVSRNRSGRGKSR